MKSLPDFLVVDAGKVCMVGEPGRQNNVQSVVSLDVNPAQKVDHNLMLVQAKLGKHHHERLVLFFDGWGPVLDYKINLPLGQVDDAYHSHT